jgi:cytochrome c553
MRHSSSRIKGATAIAALVLAFPRPGWAADVADAQAAKAKATQCFTCHGADGLAKAQVELGERRPLARIAPCSRQWTAYLAPVHGI